MTDNQRHLLQTFGRDADLVADLEAEERTFLDVIAARPSGRLTQPEQDRLDTVQFALAAIQDRHLGRAFARAA